MRRLTLAAVALALAVAPSAQAHGGPFEHRGSGELLGQWWKTVLAIPVSENPLTGNADPCITLGRRVLAPAFIAGGEISCSAEKRHPGSSRSPSPRSAATPRSRRSSARPRGCARPAPGPPPTASRINEVGIDGRVYDVRRYRVTSPDLRVRLPEEDLFGVDAASLRFTANGWAPLIEPLRPGHHVISVRSAGSDPGRPSFDDFGTLQLEVRGRRGHGPR